MVQVNDKSYEVVYLSLSANMLQMKVDGLHYGCTVVSKGDRYFVHHPSFVSIALTLVAKYPRVVQAQEKGSYTAPMPAQVVKVLVQQGESVSEGQALLVLSAMKMETTIEANESGKIASLFVDEGDLVEAGEELLLVV